MRIAHLLPATLLSFLLPASLLAAPFKPGNILVSNSPFGDQDIFEYTPAGALVQSINVSPATDGRERRQFERMLFMQPIAFLVSLAVVPVSPRNAMLSAAMSIAVLNGIARRVDRAKGARAAVPSV